MRICFLSRTDRGGRVAQVRLFGAQSTGNWSAPPSSESSIDAAIADADAAAEWVADRLASARPARVLDTVCVDCDGGICTWLTAPSGEPAVVAAAFSQGGIGTLLASGADSGEAGGEAEPTVQALPAACPRTTPVAKKSRRHAPSEDDGDRVAVMAMQDAAARLFLDGLDTRRIAVGRVCSFWHAIAEAWDAGGAEMASVREDRVVAFGSPMSAVVLIDPAGRLVWVWSRAGEVLAGGSMRLARRGEAEGTPGEPHIAAADLGRLGADWLAWSAQVGTVPSRIVCIGPPTEAGSTSRSALVTLSQGLREAWPGAAVAATAEADPIAATFLRLTLREAPLSDVDPGRAIPALSRRPGRAHRSMHLWAAVALSAGAVIAGIYAYRARAAAAEARANAAQTRADIREAVRKFDPGIAASDRMLSELRAELDRRVNSQERKTTSIDILSEVEGLAVLLAGYAGEGVELQEIKLDYIGVVKVKIKQENKAALLQVADELTESIKKGLRSALSWKEENPQGASENEMLISYLGSIAAPERSSAGEGR